MRDFSARAHLQAKARATLGICQILLEKTGRVMVGGRGGAGGHASASVPQSNDKYAVQKSAAIPVKFQTPLGIPILFAAVGAVGRSHVDALARSHARSSLQLQQGVPLVPVPVEARHHLCAGGSRSKRCSQLLVRQSQRLLSDARLQEDVFQVCEGTV